MNKKAKAYALRREVLDMVYRSKAGHIGGDFSVMEILTTLYYDVLDITPENFSSNDRDHFILSKGHSVEALYAVLSDRGFFPKEDLKTVSTFQSPYIGHPNNKINGIEMNSGSLGHGLPVAVGMALAMKLDQKPHRVYTVLGDGELAEGSNWEGAMAAGHYHLDNLCAVIDRNGLQISGTTEEVMTAEDIEKRFSAFGWETARVSGNDYDALKAAFPKAKETKGKPFLIVADTVKGKGVSFMENRAGWHHRVPTEEEYLAAKEELEKKEAFYNETESK